MRFAQALSLVIFVSFMASPAHALNPQPEPPGKQMELNPQPEPPGVTDSSPAVKALNPQPEPPGVTEDGKINPSLSASSDSHGEAHGLKGKLRKPGLAQGSDSSRDKKHLAITKPSLTRGSDSSEKKLHGIATPSLSKGSDSSEKKAPPDHSTGPDDILNDPTIGGGGAGPGR